MGIIELRSDPDFERAARSLSTSWANEDAGDSGSAERAWARRYAESLASRHGLTFEEVWWEVGRRAAELDAGLEPDIPVDPLRAPDVIPTHLEPDPMRIADPPQDPIRGWDR